MQNYIKNESVGERLRYFREVMGMSQAQIAKLFQESQSNWARYETGTRIPHTLLIELNENAFIDTDWLLSGRVNTTITNKLEHERRARFNTQREAALAIRIPEKLLAAIESGCIQPSNELVSTIAASFGINKYMLLNEAFKYHPTIKSTGDDTIDRAVAEQLTLSKTEQEIIRLLKEMPENGEIVLNFLRGKAAEKLIK